jgi:hypothetical protein
MGCVVIWVQIDIELNIGIDDARLQAQCLASLVIGEERRNPALRHEAVTDPLTGLGNRSALRRQLDSTPGPVTVAIIELDDFKPSTTPTNTTQAMPSSPSSPTGSAARYEPTTS